MATLVFLGRKSYEKISERTRGEHDAAYARCTPPGEDAVTFLELRKAIELRLAYERKGPSAISGILGRDEKGTFHIDGDSRYAMRWRMWQWAQHGAAGAQAMTPREVLLGELGRKFAAYGANWKLVKFLGGDFPKGREAEAEAVLDEFKARVAAQMQQ